MFHQLAALRHLVNCGAKPNYVTQGGMTAVMHASGAGQVDSIKTLASLGASAHHESLKVLGQGADAIKASNTALLAAIDQGQVGSEPPLRLQT